MPLIKGKKAKTKKGIEENTKREIEAGEPPKKAYAISNSVAQKTDKKPKKVKKKMY